MISDPLLTGTEEKLFLMQDKICTIFDMNFPHPPTLKEFGNEAYTAVEFLLKNKLETICLQGVTKACQRKMFVDMVSKRLTEPRICLVFKGELIQHYLCSA